MLDIMLAFDDHIPNNDGEFSGSSSDCGIASFFISYSFEKWSKWMGFLIADTICGLS